MPISSQFGEESIPSLERTRRVGVPASRAVVGVSPCRSTQCCAGTWVSRQVFARTLAILMALLVGASTATAESSGDLVRIYAERGWGSYGWEIRVSTTGQVCVWRALPDLQPTIHRLSGEEFKQFVSDLKKEGPLELPSQLGDAVIDGPARLMELSLDGRTAHIGLYSLPKGVAITTLRREASVLGRALRVCERVRGLAKDERLQPCTE